MAVILGNPIMLGGGGGSKVKKMAISNLSEGDVVRIKEKGVEQDYYLAQHDYQPSLNGSGRVLFMRKNGYDKRKWHSDSVNAYATSDIDAFLNSEFKTRFDADVREAMGETAFPYTVGNGNTTVTTLNRSIFLPSITEMGLTTANINVEGVAIPIASQLIPISFDGAASDQWTRTPYISGSVSKSGTPYINTTGSCVACYVYQYEFAYRPAFTLPNTATVLPEANLDGSYTLSLGDDNPDEQVFKLTVVGGTEQPTDVEDNTIWVNTDVDMGMCYLAPNAPASPEVGDVWVNTTNKYNSNGTNASTNLIRVNDNPYLEINVLNISQWDGSAWVNREGSAIYANGAWTSMALYLFNYGTYNENYTIQGGAANAAATTYRDDLMSHSFTTDSIYFTMSSSGGWFGVQFTPKIDFSKYTKAKAVCHQSNSGNKSINWLISISDTLLTSASYNTIQNVTGSIASTISNNAQGTIEMDLTNVTGEHYLTLRGSISTGNTLYFQIKQFVLTA